MNRADQSQILLTDQYELTMAYGYWKLGMAEDEAVFHHFYRRQPFGSGFAVTAGLEAAVEFLEAFRFAPSDIDYLRSLHNPAGKPLFEEAFFDYLKQMRFACDVDAIPEGTFVFPHQPLIRVKGPILQAQMLESALLNLINFQTLVATKAARVRIAAGEDNVAEFGLRRAHGINGGLAASRAAFIGGANGVSNTLAAKTFGIPPVGTMAHSWIMAFDTEEESFFAYAKALPDNCLMLVDTYDSIEGVAHAIAVGNELKKQGKRLIGVRLDSGDLLALSREARKMLDANGMGDATIFASGDLDEYEITRLKQSQAPITGWGVGTRLVTGHPDAALGGVYKLGAIRGRDGEWKRRMKYAGVMEKTSEPGILQVCRYFDELDAPIGDVIYDQLLPDTDARQAIWEEREVTFAAKEREDLLQPIYRGGKLVYDLPSIHQLQQRCLAQISSFPEAITRIERPASYCTAVEKHLFEKKMTLMQH